MVDRHEEFRTWSLLAAISPEPSVRAGAEYALALFRDYDALAADITSMQMAYEAAHEQAHQMRERAIAAEARLAEAERRLDERPKTWWLPWTPLETAQRLHDAYEELAPHFGYTTRPDTRQFDPDSPNGQLMIATIRRVLIEQAASATVSEVKP